RTLRKKLHFDFCCGYDTPGTLSVSSLLHIDDEPDVVDTSFFGHAHAVKRRRLHNRTGAVTREIDRLAVKQPMDEAIGECVDLHLPDREALDLVHVEAFVDPAHQQRLERLALSPPFLSQGFSARRLRSPSRAPPPSPPRCGRARLRAR